MPVQAPYPELAEMMDLIGEAGRHLAEFGASEGAAGNISCFIAWDVDPRRRFPKEEPFLLDAPVPELAGGIILATGSGRRLREVGDDPEANLGCIKISDDGKSATLWTSPKRLFEKLTSELNSHIAVHVDQVKQTKTNFNAVIHAQPFYLTYLTNIPRYQNEQYYNTHILRWQPELIYQLPEGLGYVPFAVPGSQELMKQTSKKLRNHRVVLWEKHGVMARSDQSVKRACDRIEYAETGARYEYMNLQVHESGEGLSVEQLREVAEKLGIEQSVF